MTPSSTDRLPRAAAFAALLVLAGPAAAEFACLDPIHHDGDAIRCAGMGKAMRLHAIDAPEMPGACRPGRQCIPGDPYAARDHLAALTRGRHVMCEQVDTDHYGRRVVDCTADGRNLGCAMVADGYAVERYGRLDCGATRVAARAEPSPVASPSEPVRRQGKERRYFAPKTPLAADNAFPLWQVVPLWLVAINVFGWAIMAIDKSRAIAQERRRVNRVPESTLLIAALLGGSPAVIAAQQALRHKTQKQPFATLLLVISGLQIGAIAGFCLLVWF